MTYLNEKIKGEREKMGDKNENERKIKHEGFYVRKQQLEQYENEG